MKLWCGNLVFLRNAAPSTAISCLILQSLIVRLCFQEKDSLEPMAGTFRPSYRRRSGSHLSNASSSSNLASIASSVDLGELFLTVVCPLWDYLELTVVSRSS